MTLDESTAWVEPPSDRITRSKTNDLVELIPALRAFARSFCRDASDADDLVQETLTRAIAHIDQYQHGTRMKSWLFTIMRNTFYTRARIEMREQPGFGDDAALKPTAEATQEWSVRGGEVATAINELPVQQRQVLMLIGVLGISYEETAEICECAVGTVKSRLNRARHALLDLLGESDVRGLVEANIPLTSAAGDQTAK